MKLRTKYILFVTVLHLVTLVLSFYIFKDNKPLFIASEALILVSVFFSWKLYRQLLQPLKTLMQGINAIKDRDFNIKFVHTGKHEIDELIGVYNYMIDELRTERTRQEQQHFFLEKLISTSPTGIIILDYDQRVQQLNPKASQILGMSEHDARLQLVTDIQHPLFTAISQLQPGENKTLKISGASTYRLHKTAFVDRGFARNFIMIEELTLELLAAEKNAYGKVIRLMAHEVNNTVGPVNSIIHSALKSSSIWLNNDHALLKDALEAATHRNQNLAHFMRNFADLVKLPEANKKQLDLLQLVKNTAKLMRFKINEQEVELLLNLPDEPFFIAGDEQLLEQVFINILKNASEAISGKGFIGIHFNRIAKQLIFTDTGKGIEDALSEKLFTPFFSTKKDGQGIGLTLVREILVNHGFEFSLKTVAPNRTQFSITF